MAVKPEQIENPERAIDLSNREIGSAKKVAHDELKALRARIAELHATIPQDSRPHCADCYRRGWAAALRALQE